MTNGGGIHHSVKKKSKSKKKPNKSTPKNKPTKAILAKAVNGPAN